MARDVYTADMGQPPSPDDMGSIAALRGKRPMARPMPKAAPMAPRRPRPNPADAGIYTADKGMPPSPDEGPTMGGGMPPRRPMAGAGMKKGGCVKKMKSGGSVSSASKRADGIATKGKTRGKMV